MRFMFSEGEEILAIILRPSVGNNSFPPKLLLLPALPREYGREERRKSENH